MMETDRDLAPSLHLSHTETTQKDPARSKRRTKRRGRKPALQSAEDSGEKHVEKVEDGERRNTEEAKTQAECKLCTERCVEVNRLLEENRQLRSELEEHKISDGFFNNSDDKVRYYTGLPNIGTFMALLNFLAPLMPDQNTLLSPFQMLLLTFMRLRLDLPAQHLAHLFHVSPNTICSTFNVMIAFLHANLKRSIVWPDRKILLKTMPHQFVQSFGHRVVVIINCFEICIEKPANVKTCSQMSSSSKRAHTMKYLMGVTPIGSICFLSKGWAGCTSEKHITEHSGFLGNLLPGDVVLADRGFDIQESVGMLWAEVKLPAFAKGCRQLNARDAEETRTIAHLRNHVERVIWDVCQKYKILKGTVPNNMTLPCEGEDVTFLDKIVTVCCALTNHCPIRV